MKKRHVIENNSLKVWKDGKKALTLHPQKLVSWSLRLSVRTRDFHSLKSSSTLLGTTDQLKEKTEDGKSQISIKENPSDKDQNASQ